MSKKQNENQNQTKKDPLIAARDKVNRALRRFHAAQKLWNVTAKGRTPEEWRAAIDEIADMSVRIQVANIIWWDYFGSRPASDPWPHLDDYKAAWKRYYKADSAKVTKALIGLGYHTAIAGMRGRMEYETVSED